MPVAFAPVVEFSLPPQSPLIYPPRKRWTRAECDSLEATGIWNRDRFELIEGELITKMPKSPPRMVVFMALFKWLTDSFGMQVLNPEAPIEMAPEDNLTSEPEPANAVLTRPGTDYLTTPPPASDVRLLLEVSGATLAFDLGPKARLYARAAIPEYWVADIKGRRIIVHRYPQGGVYSSVTVYAEGETVSPLALPTASLPVATAFPFPADQVPAADL